MQRSQKLLHARRLRRSRRVRKATRGTGERPRLSVFRSNKAIYVQAVDDLTGVTLASSSSLDKAVRDAASGTKTEVAKKVGEDIARRLKEAGVNKVVFDRGWYKFHGRVMALADAAREGGLQF